MRLDLKDAQNPKSEARNPKQTQKSKKESSKQDRPDARLQFCGFSIWICFGFRILLFVGGLVPL